MYKVTLELDTSAEYELKGTLPAECVETFCHGVMRDGIELITGECLGLHRHRVFIRPQAISLAEV